MVFYSVSFNSFCGNLVNDKNNKMVMSDKIENLIENIKALFRIIVLVYILFCIIMWAYYMTTLHQVPSDCSFFSFSAHIGFIFLILILMILLVCT